MNATERIIQNVASSMQLEGYSFSDKTKEKITTCLIGKATFHETVQSLVSMYKQGE